MKISKQQLKKLVESTIKEQFDIGGGENKPYKQLAERIKPLVIAYQQQGNDSVIPKLEKAAALAGKLMRKEPRWRSNRFETAQTAMKMWFSWAGFSNVESAPGEMLDRFESAFRGHVEEQVVVVQEQQKDDDTDPMFAPGGFYSDEEIAKRNKKLKLVAAHTSKELVRTLQGSLRGQGIKIPKEKLKHFYEKVNAIISVTILDRDEI